jgi:glycosyltransferase involved in cell wall biosynthesis
MTERVIINGKFLAQPITGVQRFALEMVKELLYTKVKFRIYAPAGAAVPLWLSEHVTTFGRSRSLLWEQLDLPKRLKRENSPLLVNLCNSGPMRYSNHLLVLHDVAFLAHPEWFGRLFRTWYKLLIPALVKRANHLFTVSEFSKSEIVKYFNVGAHRITVVHNGTNRQRNLHSEQKHPFILSVGSLNPRKNIGFIAEAFQRANLENWDLVIAGGESKHFKSHEQMQHPNIKWIGYQDEETLEKLYNEAALFVSASHYEGFGIPVLEAMQHGCEIALSRIPVYTELFTTHIHYFDLHDPAGLAEIMRDIASKPLKSISHAHTLSAFNYGTSANKMATVITQILND